MNDYRSHKDCIHYSKNTYIDILTQQKNDSQDEPSIYPEFKLRQHHTISSVYMIENLVRDHQSKIRFSLLAIINRLL